MDQETKNLLIYYVGAPLLVFFIAWLSKSVLYYFKKTNVKVRVHEAYFHDRNDNSPYYFIKVTNLSSKYTVTITHVWVKEGKENFNLLNNERALPYKLEPSDEWETWVSKNKVINQIKIFKNVRVKLSNDKIIKSKRNKKVPEEGYVAGK